MSAWLEAGFAVYRPRAVAALTRQFRDLDLAEDLFAEACLKAVAEWRGRGPPRDPLAWLLTVARNAGRDRIRMANRRREILETAGGQAADYVAPPDPDELRDDVLRLMFICCHPALTRQDQLALALKVVVGLTVEEIARAFLIKPRAMEQRLTRAKKAVAANPVPFETPAPQERGRRLSEVSLMVYLMFNEGWSSSGTDTQIRMSLCNEAIRLARLLLELFPGMTEQAGLLSLLLFLDARRAARVDADGCLVTLDKQDRSRWDRAAIAEATSLLQRAERTGGTGPYQIQAAIAATHALAETADRTDWPRIEALYRTLHAFQPTPVVRLNWIAALARTRGPEAALAEMAPLSQPLANYRWYHTMRGALLAETGACGPAADAYAEALDLGPTGPERAAIEAKIAECRDMA